MHMMAIGAGKITQMRRVRIRRIGRGLGGNLRVAAMTLGADRHIGLLGRRAFAVASRASESGGQMTVDQKTVAGAGRDNRA